MVERPEQWTNRPKYLYSFEFQIRPFSRFVQNPQDLAKLYLEDGLSAKQIAEQFDVSKTAVIERLQELGISSGQAGNRMTNPQNYRVKEPPYGWKKKDGKLVPNKAELKICRRIVTLVRSNRSFTSVARELVKLGFKNRAGRTKWDHKTVISIYNRWKDKL